MQVAFSHEKTSKEGYWINRTWREKCVQNETEAIGPEIPGRLLLSSRTSAGPLFFHPSIEMWCCHDSSLSHSHNLIHSYKFNSNVYLMTSKYVPPAATCTPQLLRVCSLRVFQEPQR